MLFICIKYEESMYFVFGSHKYSLNQCYQLLCGCCWLLLLLLLSITTRWIKQSISRKIGKSVASGQNIKHTFLQMYMFFLFVGKVLRLEVLPSIIACTHFNHKNWMKLYVRIQKMCKRNATHLSSVVCVLGWQSYFWDQKQTYIVYIQTQGVICDAS